MLYLDRVERYQNRGAPRLAEDAEASAVPTQVFVVGAFPLQTGCRRHSYWKIALQ